MKNLEQEHKKEHLIAVEDVIRVKKQLAGFNIVAHQDVYADWWGVFEMYYDWDIESLHNELEKLSAEACEFVNKAHPVSESSPTIFRELREDEQDTED